MVLSKIKKSIISLRRKKSTNGYLENSIELQPPPGQGQFHNSGYTHRRHSLARFRQVLKANRGTNNEGYAKNSSRQKLLFKLIGPAAVTIVFLFYVLIGDGQIVVDVFGTMPFFQVSEIEFFGTEIVSQEKLREASGIIVHQTSLIDLDCTSVEDLLSTVPWVARAEVKKNWPSTIEIFIKESVPVALLHNKSPVGTQLQYIDKNGVPFLTVRPGVDIDFPVITGLPEIDDAQLRERALAESLVFLNNVNGNNPYLPAQSVSEVHITRNGDLVVYLVEYPFPIFLGNSNIKQKYARLVQVLKAVYKTPKGKGSISQIEYIQMDYLDDKVLVSQSKSG